VDKENQHAHLAEMPSKKRVSSEDDVVQVREKYRQYCYCAYDIQIATIGPEG
jgi:hypothetical protein